MENSPIHSASPGRGFIRVFKSFHSRVKTSSANNSGPPKTGIRATIRRRFNNKQEEYTGECDEYGLMAGRARSTSPTKATSELKKFSPMKRRKSLSNILDWVSPNRKSCQHQRELPGPPLFAIVANNETSSLKSLVPTNGEGTEVASTPVDNTRTSSLNVVVDFQCAVAPVSREELVEAPTTPLTAESKGRPNPGSFLVKERIANLEGLVNRTSVFQEEENNKFYQEFPDRAKAMTEHHHDVIERGITSTLIKMTNNRHHPPSYYNFDHLTPNVLRYVMDEKDFQSTVMLGKVEITDNQKSYKKLKSIPSTGSLRVYDHLLADSIGLRTDLLLLPAATAPDLDLIAETSHICQILAMDEFVARLAIQLPDDKSIVSPKVEHHNVQKMSDFVLVDQFQAYGILLPLSPSRIASPRVEHSSPGGTTDSSSDFGELLHRADSLDA